MIGAKPARTLNTSALKNQKKQEEFTQEMDEKLKDWDSHNSENDIEEKWETLKDTVYKTAGDVLHHPERKHQDWFDDHDEEEKYSKAQTDNDNFLFSTLEFTKKKLQYIKSKLILGTAD